MNRYHDEEDEILVELTLLGNEDAYEALVVRHENAVKGSAYRVTGNRFSAEDASQDAFVSAWINLDTLRDKSHFGAWVASIARITRRQRRNMRRNKNKRHKVNKKDHPHRIGKTVSLCG